MIVAGFVGAAAAGGIVRWWAGRGLPAPLGTLTVNLAGAFALGLLMGAGATTRSLAGVAFLGSCTTFSTVMTELRDLVAAGERRVAGAYALATLVGGPLLAWLGLQLA